MCPGAPAEVIVRLAAERNVDDVMCILEIGRGDTLPLATIEGPTVRCPVGETVVVCRVGCLALEAGRYDLRVRLFSVSAGRRADGEKCVKSAVFRLRRQDSGRASARGRGGVVHLPSEWRVETGAVPPGNDAD